MNIDSRIIVGGFLVALGIIIALLVSGVVPAVNFTSLLESVEELWKTALSSIFPVVIAYIVAAAIICIGLAVIILGKKEREIEEV